MSVGVALEALEMYREFTDSAELLEDIRSDALRGDTHRFVVENGTAVIRSGGNEARGGYAEHGEFPVDLVPAVSKIIDDYLGTKPKHDTAEEYVLGLYMHDPKRDVDVVTALGKFLNEDNK